MALRKRKSKKFDSVVFKTLVFLKIMGQVIPFPEGQPHTLTFDTDEDGAGELILTLNVAATGVQHKLALDLDDLEGNTGTLTSQIVNSVGVHGIHVGEDSRAANKT
jgi:hypothetical protein